jgi:hypothetical protein
VADFVRVFQTQQAAVPKVLGAGEEVSFRGTCMIEECAADTRVFRHFDALISPSGMLAESGVKLTMLTSFLVHWSKSCQSVETSLQLSLLDTVVHNKVHLLVLIQHQKSADNLEVHMFMFTDDRRCEELLEALGLNVCPTCKGTKGVLK